MTEVETELAGITGLLAERIGLDPTSIGYKSIELAAKRRMSKIGLTDVSEFLKLIRSDFRELDTFIEMIVVPETWFFRDVHPFLFLKEEVLSRFMTPVSQSLRILSIPCSTGEEAYSIAISMRDINFLPQKVEIDAVDISERALEKAKKGVYGKSAFRGNDSLIKNRYFTEDDGVFALHSKIKEMVNFRNGNIIDPAFPAGVPKYDIIFCRNLVIYLDAAGRDVAVANIKRLLKSNGLLFAGHTEVMFFSAAGFVPDTKTKTFVLYNSEGRAKRNSVEIPPRKGSAEIKGKRNLVNIPPRRSNAEIAGKRSSTEMPPERHSAVIGTKRNASEVTAKRHTGITASNGKQGETPAINNSGNTSAPLNRGNTSAPLNGATPGMNISAEIETVRRLADRGKFETARKQCELLLLKNPADRELLCLLGVIYNATGLIEEAESSFLKVLYLEPDNLEALAHISLLYEKRGDTMKARIYTDRLRRSGNRNNNG